MGGAAQVAPLILFAGNFEPENWVACDGRLMQIRQNQALFSLLGTMYGGDGVNTFALPDLRQKTSDGKILPAFTQGKPTSIICINGVYPSRG